MRRFGSRRHTHRTSLRASWIRARKDLRETDEDEYWRRLCIIRHPGIDEMDLSRSDEEAWEAHLRKQVQVHEDRVRQLREEGLRRVGLGAQEFIKSKKLRHTSFTKYKQVPPQEFMKSKKIRHKSFLHTPLSN